MGEPFLGSEALAAGVVTRHELQRWHRRLFPDVYVDKGAQPSLRDRTVAAWLWSRRRAVVGGIAAAALHSAEWVDVTVPIELIGDGKRPPPGVILRNDALASDEITTRSGIAVTTVVRTAFDLGRRLARDEAVMRLDALKRATGYRDSDVQALIRRHRGGRGLASLRTVLPLVDQGAMSPRETWLRLLLLDAGLPAPTTQVRVIDQGRLVRTLDLCWREYLVGVEYDGDQHRTDRRQCVKDATVKRKLAAMGWHVTYAIKEDRPADVVASARDALIARGWQPRPESAVPQECTRTRSASPHLRR